MGEAPDQAAIIEKFSELRVEAQQMAGKVAEVMSDLNEHELVAKTLEPLDGDRKAWRLVGDVLVERTVKEVLPAVKSTAELLKQTVEKMQSELEAKRTELSEYQAKYRIRVRGEDPESDESPDGPSTGGPPGILVAKK